MSETKVVMAYAVKNKDKKILKASRSGGFFSALSDIVLEMKGIIYGCVLDDSFRAVHVRAETDEIRDRMRGSKYVQSDVGNIFKEVKTDLLNGKVVLFTGTSCQIAGLKSFLGGEYNNLLCVDILCHGVPSPLIWQDYLQWMEKKYGTCIKVDFRNKENFGWREHIETLSFKRRRKNLCIDSRVYTTLFYKHLVIRPSCFVCPYKKCERISDITIADYWGVENNVPQFDDNKGVSLVIVNNEKGEEFFEILKDKINFIRTDINNSLQPPLIGNYELPQERKQFWEDYKDMSFNDLVSKYAKENLYKKIKLKLKRLIY